MTSGIHVEDAGTGVPVLAIHGLGGGAHFFAGLAERLHTEFRILSVDLPGTGRSASSASFSMDSWIADLGALVAERIGEPVVVLGHSMGTILALKAWEAWPDRVRGLVFAGGLPRVRAAIRDRLTERLSAMKDARDLTGWGPRVSPGVFSPATIRDRPDVVASFEHQFERQPVETYVRCCRILLESSAEHVVPTVTVPSLAITGADDQYAPPDAVAVFAQEMPRCPRLEILPECGHLPFLERPDDFAAVVKTFLRTC